MKAVGNWKIISITLLTNTFLLFPIFLYDISHGFPQTVKFPLWVVYSSFRLFGFHTSAAFSSTPFSEVVNFFFFAYRRFLFPFSQNVSIVLFILSAFTNIVLFYKKSQRKESAAIIPLYAVGLLALASFFGAKTVSDAYMPLSLAFFSQS